MSRSARVLSILVPVLLLLYGVWSFPLALFGPERALLPGDLGDSRFNNYILEHFHQFTSGKIDHYWDAPFMYPYRNVIALSDDLLGTAPIYSAFRHLGYSRESAYQFWILALFILNYVCCFIALRRLSKHAVLSACGAYIFAFGIYNMGQIGHLQVLPKFMLPLAFYFFWRLLGSGGPKYLLLTVLAVVYQFYCGIYLGFMLLYVLMFVFIAYALMHRGRWFRQWSCGPRQVIPFMGILLCGAGLLYPLLSPYVQASRALGTRHFEDVVNTIPRVASYFFAHPAASSWVDLSRHGMNSIPEYWNHFLFMGALPWMAIMVAPFVLFSKRIGVEGKRPIMVLAMALALSIGFCLNIGGHTLYSLIFQVPGFSALRAIDRIINVEAMLFVALFVLVFGAIRSRQGVALLASLCLPLLVVLDNKVDVHVKELPRYDKYAAQELVKKVELDIAQQRDTAFDAIAYMPARCIVESDLLHGRTIAIQLTAMLAAQHLHVPIVNAYTGSYPGNYISFFDHMDQPTLEAWCAFNKITAAHIQPINNVGQEISRSDTVQIEAPNNLFVSADITAGNIALADRSRPLLWETFLRIHLSDGRYAFLAHNDAFMCAEIFEADQVSAKGEQLGDLGMFTVEEFPGDRVALKAFNGKYVSLDTMSHRLFAVADSVGVNELYRFIHTPR